jgi:hypothetical protein
MRCLASAAVLCLALVVCGVANAATTVSFFSHGWRLGQHGFIAPHAFVLIRRTGQAGEGPTREGFGFTSAGQDPAPLMQPTPGDLKTSTLHFTVEATEAQYLALKVRVAAWAAPGAALHDLKGHNGVPFVAELASILGLATPPPTGRDPGKFLEGVRRLNPGRMTVAPAGTL